MSYTSDNVSLIRSNTNSTAFDSGDIWTASNNGSSIISTDADCVCSSPAPNMYPPV
jgi:hypothetical protein